MRSPDYEEFLESLNAHGASVLETIREFFGGSDLGLTVSDLSDPERMIQLGVAPSRIDLIKSLSSELRFESAWENRAFGSFSEVPTQYLSLRDLIREKETAGRAQDRADAIRLREALSEQEE